MKAPAILLLVLAVLASIGTMLYDERHDEPGPSVKTEEKP